MMTFSQLPEILKAREILEKHKFSTPYTDVKEILKLEGIQVEERQLPDGISGVLDMRNIKNPVVLVGYGQNINRQRFSMAHELGHFLLHTVTGVHMDKQTFFRSQLSAAGTDEKEKQANRFAAELLMPSNLLLQDIKESHDLIDSDDADKLFADLAEKYGVSTAALSIKISGLLKVADLSD